METTIVLIFIVGYLGIVFEHQLNLNKVVPALLMGVLSWAIIGLFSGYSPEKITELAAHNLGGTAGILFFLMGAMALIGLIDAHKGFDLITNKIKTKNIVNLLWIVGGTTFFLSAILDNLTTSIVMVTLLRKLVNDKETRMLFCGIIIIAANAGGAWSPIGDVTTTMLWIDGQISSISIIKSVFFPSLISIIVPIIWLSYRFKRKNIENEELKENETNQGTPSATMLSVGIVSFLCVPLLKALLHIPPHMGMLLMLAISWSISEFINSKKDKEIAKSGSIKETLEQVDHESILFFLGLFMAIGALEITGVLHSFADQLSHTIGNQDVIVIAIGGLSAIVDNVPLVAASQGMYSLTEYPMDHKLWSMMAYSAGTGGSMLIIGSVAGVAVMGKEKISFMWYLKNIGPLALVSFLSGIGVFLLQYALLH